jgi:hypothetical protein
MSTLEEQRAAWDAQQAAPLPPPLTTRQRQVVRQQFRIGWSTYQLHRWMVAVLDHAGEVRELSDDQAARAVRVLAAYPTNNPNWEAIAPHE